MSLKGRIDMLTIKAIDNLLDMPELIEKVAKDKDFITVASSDLGFIVMIDFTKKMTYDWETYKRNCHELYDAFNEHPKYYEC
jgi:hypothetical protein